MLIVNARLIRFTLGVSDKKTLSQYSAYDLILDNHKIEKPSLLGIDINDLLPVTIDAD